MADEESPVVSDEPNIEDVSLLDTDIAPKTDEKPSEPAEKGEDKPADAEGEAPKTDEKSDAKDTEAIPEETPEEEKVEPADPVKTDKQRAYQEYQNRQRTKQQVASQIDEKYAPQTEEQLIDQGLDPADARYQALREEINFKEQRTQIAELNSTMAIDAVNVTSDFAVYNPKSPEYDEAFTKEVEEAYRTAARLKTDEENNIVLNAEVPLYDFYQRMANIYSRGASKGSKEGQQEMQKMLSRTEDVGGSSSTTKGNSLADLEERLGDMVIS